jgi:hypothetical protein
LPMLELWQSISWGEGNSNNSFVYWKLFAIAPEFIISIYLLFGIMQIGCHCRSLRRAEGTSALQTGQQIILLAGLSFSLSLASGWWWLYSGWLDVGWNRA